MHLLVYCRSCCARGVRGAVLLLVCAAVTACRREEIQVYEASKDKAPPPPTPSSTRPEEPALALPSLKWAALPAGWQSRDLSAGPSRTRVASFEIDGGQGKSAELSVVAIPGMGGDDLEFVNMWRNQIRLEPIGAADLGKYVQDISIAANPGKLFSMEGAEGPKPDDAKSVLVAMLVRERVSWFFKLAGDAPIVHGQKAALIGFLKDLAFTEAPAQTAVPPMASTPSAGGGAEGAPALPKWTVPPGWTSVTPGQMVLAKFTAAGEASTKVDITVSSFPGDVGGLLANVNRWRDQLGLPRLLAPALASETQLVDLSEGKATLVDFSGTDAKTGQPARLVGAVVPRSGVTWFYKMMGHAAVAEREKTGFVSFVRSANYSHDH